VPDVVVAGDAVVVDGFDGCCDGCDVVEDVLVVAPDCCVAVGCCVVVDD
jgi:hypothetical protein